MYVESWNDGASIPTLGVAGLTLMSAFCDVVRRDLHEGERVSG